MTDLEITQKILREIRYSYQTEKWNKCIVMDVFISDELDKNDTTYRCTILFNLDGSFNEEVENAEQRRIKQIFR